MGLFDGSNFERLFGSVKTLIEKHPESVSQLFVKHRIKAAPTYRNVSNAIRVKPDFYESLTSMLGYHGGGDNFTGSQERITLADKLANAGLVFSNIIRETQRPAEPYNKIVPNYYEPTGTYNVRTLPSNRPNRLFGMDKKFVWIIGGVLVLVLLYELSKRK